MSFAQILLASVLVSTPALTPFAATVLDNAQEKAAAPRTSLGMAKHYADMHVSQWPQLSAAERYTAYDQISRLYVDQVRKMNTKLGHKLELYLVISPENKGRPKGRDRYLQDVQAALDDNSEGPGVFAHRATLYGPIVDCGMTFIDEMRKVQEEKRVSK